MTYQTRTRYSPAEKSAELDCVPMNRGDFADVRRDNLSADFFRGAVLRFKLHRIPASRTRFIVFLDNEGLV